MRADNCGSSKKWFKCSFCQLCINDFQKMKNHMRLKHFDTWCELERNTTSTNSENSEDQQRNSSNEDQGKRKESIRKSGRFNKLEEENHTQMSRLPHPDSEYEDFRVEESTSDADDDEKVTEKGSRKWKRRNLSDDESVEARNKEEENDDIFAPVKPAKKVLILLDEGFQSGIKTEKSADHCGSSNKWFKCSTCQLCLTDFQKMKSHVRLKHFGTWIELGKNTSSTNSASSEDQQRNSHKEEQGERKKSSWKNERFNTIEESPTRTRLSLNRHPDSEEVRVEEATRGADDNEKVTEKGSRKRKRRNKTLSYYSIGLVHTFREKEKSKRANNLISYKQRKTSRQSSRVSSSNVKRPYRCKYCISSFRNRHQLSVHLRVHTGQRPFHCIFCPKSFTQITNLDNHVRSHIKEKPYKCKTCKKEFTQVTNLVFHERVHSNVKPYQCKVCGRKFAQISNWNSHQKSHK